MKAKRTVSVMLLVMLSACLLGLTACGNKAVEPASAVEPVSNEQITSDVQARDAIFEKYDLEVNYFSITQNQISTDDKIDTDTVRCSVSASSSDLSYTAEYEIKYILFKDNWELENYCKEASSAVPLQYPTKEDAEPYLRKQTGRPLEVKEAIIQDTEYDVLFPFSYTQANGQGVLSYHFDVESGWKPKIEMMSRKEWSALISNAY